MNTPNTTVPRTTGTLRAAITGQVFAPGEAGYDQARQAWNLAVDERPAVVVEAGSAADVAQAVRYARAHGMRIAPQGTGHGAETARAAGRRDAAADHAHAGGAASTRPPAPPAPKPARCGRT